MELDSRVYVTEMLFNLNSKGMKNLNFSLKVQMKCFSFIAEFERAAKIRKNAVYRFLISLLRSEL